jgi:hypothetical protein
MHEVVDKCIYEYHPTTATAEDSDPLQLPLMRGRPWWIGPNRRVATPLLSRGL